MDFLKQHSIRINKHDWQEEEWDTRIIGFFTKVVPKCMPKEYATKVITSVFQKNKANVKIPSFRLQNISLRTDRTSTRGFGLEVKAEDSRAITAAIKANVTPGSFVPFNLRAANEIAFKKGIENVHYVNNNTWSFIVHYVSEGTFFKLENRIKTEMSIEHIIYDPTNKTMTIITAKKDFDKARDFFKANIEAWSQSLDPEDTRQFGMIPEIAHLARDDLSRNSDSYTTNSINSILSFDIDEIVVKKASSKATITPTTTATTPSDLSEPVVNESHRSEINKLKEEIQSYKKALEMCTTKMEGFQAILETINGKVSQLPSAQLEPTEQVSQTRLIYF